MGSTVNEKKRKKRSVIRRGGELEIWNMYKQGSQFIIPYYISDSIESIGKREIDKAIDEIQSKSCLKFLLRTDQDKYIKFYKGDGCYSPVGFVQNHQKISLHSSCWKKSTVVHEILHSLGFWHEQSRPDRDDYVDIKFRNIPPTLHNQFSKRTTDEVDYYGTKYDYKSIMHYGGFAFSIDGSATITNKQTGEAIVKQKLGLSETDALQLNRLYGCSEKVCVDKHDTCTTYECNSDPDWAKENCCATCNSSTTNQPSTTATYNTATYNTRCSNYVRHCETWGEQGYCNSDTYKVYMRKNCCATCSPKTNCHDKNLYCRAWTRIGECQRNPVYMNKYCCRSCSTRVTIRTTTPTTTTTTTESICYDHRRHCKTWASRGYCSRRRNRIYMQKKCCRSCRSLKSKSALTKSVAATRKVQSNSTQTLKCSDNKENCASWATAGECNTNPNYMLAQCCRSCKTNHGIQMSDEQTCSDSNNFCMSWSMNGECANNPMYMKKKCCDSCTKYQNCTDGHVNCKKWAQHGHCRGSFSEFMKKNCLRSCNYC